MPLISSSYKAPIASRNTHLATIYSGLFRKVRGVKQERERITLSDGDFIDLDWSFAKKKTNKLMLLLHGLEGDAQRPYILGAAKIFVKNNIDVVAVNHRSCSGEPNLLYRSYNSGATEDLHDVLKHILDTRSYTDIFLKGFSLGGNIVLKYLGEQKFEIPSQIKSAIAVSVPCSLNGSCIELHKFKNILYATNFLIYLKAKLKIKQKQFPKLISKKDIQKIKTLRDFDDVYTSKAHGYIDATDYYTKCSSLQFLHNIKVPTLLINAKNDSFLSEDCFPYAIANSNPNLFLETPKYGGHVAFIKVNGYYYNEIRAVEFAVEGK